MEDDDMLRGGQSMSEDEDSDRGERSQSTKRNRQRVRKIKCVTAMLMYKSAIRKFSVEV